MAIKAQTAIKAQMAIKVWMELRDQMAPKEIQVCGVLKETQAH